LSEAIWIVDDKRWFERHPNRSHRLRRPLRGELAAFPNAEPHGLLYIIVWQIAPGIRLRVATGLRRTEGNTEENARRALSQVLPILPLSEAEYKEFAAAVGASDNCQACDRPFNSGDLTLVGLDQSGTPIDVGSCCAHRLRALAGLSLYLANEDVPASALASLATEGRA
jgi:hypothetical protein